MSVHPHDAAVLQFQNARRAAPKVTVGVVLDDPASAFGIAVLRDLLGTPWVHVPWVAQVRRAAGSVDLVDAADPLLAASPVWLERREAQLRRATAATLDPSAIVSWPDDLGAGGGFQRCAWQPVKGGPVAVEVVLWCAASPVQPVAGEGGTATWCLSAGQHSTPGGLRTRVEESLARATTTAITLMTYRAGDSRPTELLSMPLRRMPTPWRAPSGAELAWEGRMLLLRGLRERHEAHAEAGTPLPRPSDDELPVSIAQPGGALARSLRWATGEARKVLRRVTTRRASGREWRLSLRSRDDAQLPLWHGGAWDGSVVDQPSSQFWADPFLVEEGDTTWLFFETFLYPQDRGTLSVAPLLADGSLGEVRECLATDGHLSYPQVIRHQGDFYMIPESTEAGSVCLYRARKFPTDWVLEKVLFRGHAVDTTCLEHEGRWYFFTSVSGFGAQFPLQCLFVADRLDGEWRPHPCSPVSMGLRAERGAGAIFRDGSRLIRPVQDGLGGYGHSLAFHEIVRLDEQVLEEKPLATLRPDWAPGLLGTHSYARSSRWEVIDGLWNRYR